MLNLSFKVIYFMSVFGPKYNVNVFLLNKSKIFKHFATPKRELEQVYSTESIDDEPLE